MRSEFSAWGSGAVQGCSRRLGPVGFATDRCAGAEHCAAMVLQVRWTFFLHMHTLVPFSGRINNMHAGRQAAPPPPPPPPSFAKRTLPVARVDCPIVPCAACPKEKEHTTRFPTPMWAASVALSSVHSMSELGAPSHRCLEQLSHRRWQASRLCTLSVSSQRRSSLSPHHAQCGCRFWVRYVLATQTG